MAFRGVTIVLPVTTHDRVDADFANLANSASTPSCSVPT